MLEPGLGQKPGTFRLISCRSSILQCSSPDQRRRAEDTCQQCVLELHLMRSLHLAVWVCAVYVPVTSCRFLLCHHAQPGACKQLALKGLHACMEGSPSGHRRCLPGQCYINNNTTYTQLAR